MTEPRYQFWRTIQPVEGQPIPNEAQYRVAQAGCKTWCPSMTGDTFRDVDKVLEWRVPVEVVPIDLAVDAIVKGSRFSEGFRSAGLPHLAVSFAGGLVARTPEQLRELVITKLRELSQENVNEAI